MGSVRLSRVAKTYGREETRVWALREVTLSVEPGTFVVILGPSGSGKTTLLNLIGALDVPSEGRVEVAGHDLTRSTEAERARFRRHKVGFVFQFFNLVPTLTARENVLLAAELVPHPRDPDALLAAVGLSHRKHHFPGELSGGEQQRVAVARALAKNPEVILADEPTGSLDSQSGAQVLALLWRFARDEGRTVLMVTHNQALAQIADRVLRLKDGRIVEDRRNEEPRTPEEVVW
ncbi:Phosphonate-transporting ATPase [Marinithermus hydrothermalis DSM 14884]|uniref:Phosphonate-transporting ATPase n=1 Tax=Marinithermus hydrothermalis (strain DSM 14884 / JCM 11576 / T1) TaxID=869210 RepID=F2NLF5_MARHT|nr:ABC transporter ATP-binding protein [Marinithermus hydrothermalis]AEB11774.1 Phosphonate-transporting ATPase [Marinithermus hydrothermalis DSM 14884]